MKKKITSIAMLALASCALVSCGAKNDSAKKDSGKTEEVSKDVTVTFISDGATYDTKTAKNGSELVLPTPTKDGYDFIGWYKDASFNTEFTSRNYPNDDVTLYAKWDARYQTLKMVANNGQGVYESKVIEGTTLNIEEPKLDGCEFAGWYTDKELTTPFSLTKMPTETVSIYAKWKALEGTAFVSTTGAATNSGAYDSPIDFESALARLDQSNEAKLSHIYLLPGKYEFTKRQNLTKAMSGNHNGHTVIAGIDGVNLAILNFKNQNDGNQGVVIQGDYIKMANLVVEYAHTYGVYVSGSNNIVENVEARYNGNTGIGVGGNSSETIATWPCNNLIKNCTSHDNYDYNNGGEDADGFSCKLTNGHNNVFDGCISFGNSDDGYDLYAKNSSGNTGVTKIINCIAFRNGFLSDTNNPTGRGDLTYTNGRTKNGDGNGFKLGGEVMYDNVYVENCISFENGANGFTDNSNPGVIAVKNCTAFNNGLFELGKSDNFNLARTESSLNTFDGLLSIATNNPAGSDNEDDFRGPISNSIVIQNTKNGLDYFKIGNVINGNSVIDKLSGEKTNINVNNIFESTDISLVYTQNEEAANAVHLALRNADGSVNLGNYLKIKDEEILTFNNGKAIGGNLSEDNDTYNHYARKTVASDATDDMVKASNIYDQLTIPCREDAVYEDLDLYKQINGYDITWTSSNTDVVSIDTVNVNAKDQLKSLDTYFTGKVVNPSADTKVVITASWTVGEAQMSKEFELTIKSLTPIGGKVEGVDDTVLFQGDTLEEDIVIYDVNGRSKEDIVDPYDVAISVETKYLDGGSYVKVDSVDTNKPGIYKLIYTFTIAKSNDVTVIEREVEVIDEKATLEIKKLDIAASKLTVETSWKAGDIYVVVVPKNATAPTAEEIKAQSNYAGVTLLTHAHASVAGLSTDVAFENAIYGDYVAYAVCENANGLGEVKKVEAIKPSYVSTAKQLYDICTRDVGEKEVIILENDIDFTGFEWTMTGEKATFKGVINGNGHKISNLTIEGGSSYTGNAGMIENAVGATFENLVFENCVLNAEAAGQAGLLVATASSSVFTNIKMTNVKAIGNTNTGALLGYADQGDVYLLKISLDNTQAYWVEAKTKQAGGIVGCLMGGPTDDSPNTLTLTDIYVNSNVTTGKNGYVGGIVGRVKDNPARTLVITNAVYLGDITGKYAGTTVGGGDKDGLGSKWLFTNIVTYSKIVTSDSSNGTLYGRIQSNAILGLECTNTYFVSTSTNAKASKAKQNAQNEIAEADLTESFYSSMFDLVNTWSYADGKISLK